MKSQIFFAGVFTLMAGVATAEETPKFQTFEDVEAHATSLGLAFQKVRNIEPCIFFDNVPVEVEDFRVYFDDDGQVAIDCFAPIRPKLRPSPNN